MPFTPDTAITTDTHFLSILAIQNLEDLRRATGGWDDDADNIHNQAVNKIIRRLKPLVDPAKVTNQNDAREWAITWAAAKIYRQAGLDNEDATESRRWLEAAEALELTLPGLWDEFVAAIEFDTGTDGSADRRMGKGLPRVMNVDSGGRLAGHRGRGVKRNRGLPGFDDAVQDGTNGKA